MKIVTFNIRWNNPEDGAFTFDYRKDEIIARIKKEQADVIGFQEIREDMQGWLEEHMPEYVFVGHGRNSDFTGESISIAYRKNTFKMRRFECFWLSQTPDIPGSKFKQQGYHPRMCNVATLYSIKDKKSIRIMNTHLDNECAYARKEGMKLILEKSNTDNEQEKLSTFILGDFNAFPDSDEITPIMSCCEYADVSKDILVTYHGFYQSAEKIDYIFVNDLVKIVKCDIWDTEEGRICLSDHYPVCLECEI